MIARLAALLLLFSTAVAADVPVSTAPLLAAVGNCFQPQVASDGTNFLVVWLDGRAQNNNPPVWSTLVGPDGRVVGPPGGSRVSPRGSRGAAVVVWTGASYLIAWTDDDGIIEAVRVGRDGRVLDTTPQRIGVDPITAGAAAAAGDRALIVTTGSGVVTVWVVDENGKRITITTLWPYLVPLSNASPVVASNGSAFLMAWAHTEGSKRSVAIAPVSRAGVVGTPRLIPAKGLPAMTSNGGDYLLVYADDSATLVAERLAEDGSTIARTALPYSMTNAFAAPVAAPYGDGYAIAPPTPAPIIRVDRNGRRLGELAFPNTNTGNRAALASNGSDTLAVWSTTYTSSSQIFARLLGRPMADTLLSLSAPPQRKVTIASNGDGMLAAWLEFRVAGQSPQVRAGRFTRDGVPLDGEGILVASEAASYPLAATFDGLDYVVAWVAPQYPGEVMYARVTTAGQLLDPDPRPVGMPSTDPALASNGNGSVLVFVGLGGVRAAPIHQDGSIGFPERISWEAEAVSRPRIAWSGSMWLVAWEWLQPLPPYSGPPIGAPPPPPTHDIYAARLTPSLQLLDPVPLAVSDRRFWDEAQPSVASNGSDFLVAWREYAGVAARRISTDGTLGAPVAFSRGTTSPSATARGSDYVVAWVDAPNIVFAPFTAPSLRLPLAGSADYYSSVTLLGGLAAYDHIAAEPQFGGVARGFLRSIEVARPRPARP